MPEEHFELNCREVGVDCDFVARGNTDLQVVEACAAHASDAHRMQSFPPKLWVQMRRKVRRIPV